MKTLLYTVWCATVILLLPAGCVKDKLHDTPHPRHGALVVTIDRPAAPDDPGDGSNPEVSLAVRVDKGTVAAADGSHCYYPELLAPGTHAVLVHDAPAGITVEGNVATVANAADSTLLPLPGYLMAYAADVAVAADDTTRVTARLSCRVTPVKLRLTMNAATWRLLADLRGELEGVVASTDLVTGNPVGESRTVPLVTESPVPGQLPDDATVDVLMYCHLVGVSTTAPQTFVLTITPREGNAEILTSDISSYFSDFNTARQPVTLTTTIEYTPSGSAAEIIGSIQPWTVVKGEDTEAK